MVIVKGIIRLYIRFVTGQPDTSGTTPPEFSEYDISTVGTNGLIEFKLREPKALFGRYPEWLRCKPYINISVTICAYGFV